MRHKATPWSEGEEDYVREHYGKTPTAEIARKLGRRPAMVWSKAYDMGLRLKPDQMRRDDLLVLLSRVVDQMLWEEAQ